MVNSSCRHMALSRLLDFLSESTTCLLKAWKGSGPNSAGERIEGNYLRMEVPIQQSLGIWNWVSLAYAEFRAREGTNGAVETSSDEMRRTIESQCE